jgi:glycosyltransferase involved in cell wall biosynthesis
MTLNLFDNSFTSGACGGNIRCLKIFKEIKEICPELKLNLTTSWLGYQFYKDAGLDVQPLFSSCEKKVANFYWAYFIRLGKLVFWAVQGVFKNQVIYCNSDYLVDVLPAFFSKIFHRSPWVQVCQLILKSPQERDNTFSNYVAYFCQKISFSLMRKADLIVTDGYEIQEILIEKHGLSPEKVKVGFLGVDFEEVDAAVSSKEKYDLIFIGTLDQRKGVKDFIKVCGSLMKDRPSLKALIIAEKDKHYAECEKMGEGLGILSNLSFSGRLDHGQIFSYLKNSKIFLYPSHNESWALVICEAMACGTICLVRNLDAYRKIYENSIIYCDDNSNFVEQAERYLENELLREELSQEEKSFIRRYSWLKVAQQELGFIEGFLKNKNKNS